MSTISENHRTIPLQYGQGDTPATSFLDEGNQYVLDCLTNIGQMADIQSEWEHLEQSSGEPFIYFQSFDWCNTWCQEFSADNKTGPHIKIYALRRNGELIMVWPMMIVHSRAGIRNLTFLSEPHGQYGNIICNRKLLSPEIGKRVWKHIKSSTDVDAVIFDQYPKTSLLRQIIDGNGVIEKSDRHASILDLDAFENWEDYHSSLSKNQRKQRNQRRNKLTKLGRLEYKTHFGGSSEYIKLVSTALEWKQIWLHETGRRADVLSKDDTRKFLSKLSGNVNAGDGSPNGAVIGVLSLDDKPIGIEIGMCLEGHYYSYLGAFEWNHRHLSPGKIQIEEAQVWAKKAGLKKFDFLGDPAEYKSALTNTMDMLESRSVPISTRGFIYCMFWKAHLKPMARLLFNKLTAKNRSKLLNILGISDKEFKRVAHTPSLAANADTIAINKQHQT
ncbi:MAG: GNAT family N-acetyltransferase [Rhizobiaceae bacterium]|nr:GNAT family N-acetyltransferase [Rhizobiaceae bacterium]